MVVVAFIVTMLKKAAGTATDNERLKNTTLRNETQNVMDKTAKGISWMEDQWETAKINAIGQSKVTNTKLHISSDAAEKLGHLVARNSVDGALNGLMCNKFISIYSIYMKTNSNEIKELMIFEYIVCRMMLLFMLVADHTSMKEDAAKSYINVFIHNALDEIYDKLFCGKMEYINIFNAKWQSYVELVKYESVINVDKLNTLFNFYVRSAAEHALLVSEIVQPNFSNITIRHTSHIEKMFFAELMQELTDISNQTLSNYQNLK
jgi:hypothetical protein